MTQQPETIFIVDDDFRVREALVDLFASKNLHSIAFAGWNSETHAGRGNYLACRIVAGISVGRLPAACFFRAFFDEVIGRAHRTVNRLSRVPRNQARAERFAARAGAGRRLVAARASGALEP